MCGIKIPGASGNAKEAALAKELRTQRKLAHIPGSYKMVDTCADELSAKLLIFMRDTTMKMKHDSSLMKIPGVLWGCPRRRGRLQRQCSLGGGFPLQGKERSNYCFGIWDLDQSESIRELNLTTPEFCACGFCIKAIKSLIFLFCSNLLVIYSSISA